MCRKRYSHKFRLTEHMMVHTGERPYKCDLWGNVFSQKCRLVKHDEDSYEMCVVKFVQ